MSFDFTTFDEKALDLFNLIQIRAFNVPHAERIMPADLKANRVFMEAVVITNPSFLKNSVFYNDRDFNLKVAEYNGLVLEYSPFNGDPEVIDVAIKSNPKASHFTRDNLAKFKQEEELEAHEAKTKRWIQNLNSKAAIKSSYTRYGSSDSSDSDSSDSD